MGVNHEECVAQCNADQGCTHMEWGLNGHSQNQCVIFSPQQQQGIAPRGWTFVLGNGGASITQANGWSQVSTCSAKVHPDLANYNFIGTGSCRSDNHLTYPNHYLTGYWGYEAVCGGAICEMEPGLALALTPQPYRNWWAASCKVVQCKFNPRRLHEAKSGQLRGTFV